MRKYINYQFILKIDIKNDIYLKIAYETYLKRFSHPRYMKLKIRSKILFVKEAKLSFVVSDVFKVKKL